MKQGRKSRRIAALMGLAVALALPAAWAEAPQFFRIGTGHSGATYYPVASLIAHALSAPPGAPDCGQPGECGVPGLVISAIETPGSVSNAEAVQSGQLESAFIQGDIAVWAHEASGPWQGVAPASKLRAIASLYPESVHLVTSAASGIRNLQDLRGKRVSLDEPGSGTLVEARLILDAAGLAESDLTLRPLSLPEAVADLQAGTLDAFFFMGGYPAASVAELASRMPVHLVPIPDAVAQRLVATHPFLSRNVIPAGTYEGQTEEVASLSVSALWVTSADQPSDRIHALTQALWSDATLTLLREGHVKGREIRLETALEGVGLPLHPGAARFYRDVGLLD